MVTILENIESLVKVIGIHKYSLCDEKELQRGIEIVLQKAGFQFKREALLTRGNIIDFLVEPGIGIEVKVRGSLSEIVRQVYRYLEFDRVKGMLVVTARSQLANLPSEINGRPVRVLPLLRSLF